MTLLEATLIGIALLIGLAAIAFWIAMMRHCWLNTTPGSRERWVWLSIVVLGKIPGALGYFLLRVQGAPGEGLAARPG